jgi:uncharacterized protein (UPF0147 family)
MGKRLCNEAIISALLSEGSIKGAAASLDCKVPTIYARMKQPDFQQQYAQARGELIKAATAKLQNHMTAAVDVLAELMNDETVPKQTRVYSAVNILQIAKQYTSQTEIIERLEELEANVRGSE